MRVIINTEHAYIRVFYSVKLHMKELCNNQRL